MARDKMITTTKAQDAKICELYTAGASLSALSVRFFHRPDSRNRVRLRLVQGGVKIRRGKSAKPAAAKKPKAKPKPKTKATAAGKTVKAPKKVSAPGVLLALGATPVVREG